MQSVKSARQRLQRYPEALTKCAGEATEYGLCVSAKENVKKGECQKEFEALKTCVKNVLKMAK